MPPHPRPDRFTHHTAPPRPGWSAHTAPADHPAAAHRPARSDHSSNTYPSAHRTPHNPGPIANAWLDSNEPQTADANRGGAGWLPERVHVEPRHVVVDGTTFSASLAIVGYPRQVHPGWLTPLLTHPARLDVALHIEPVPTALAARRLRQQLARLESTRALHADKGRLADPHTDTAAEDAEELATRLARGETRLHRVGLYLTVHASSQSELTEQLHAVQTLAASMLLEARPTTYRALHAWTTTLPLAIDSLGRRRVMDTDALASTVPITSIELPAGDPLTATPPAGVVYGHNLATGGLVVHDRFAAPNHNAVVLASSGAGKSYLAKLELLRSLYRGIEVIVIDPEDEYARLAAHVGGTHLRLGAPDVRINPLDLPHHAQTQRSPGHPPPTPQTAPTPPRHAEGDVLTRRALYMHTILAVLLGELTANERVLADRAIHTTYTRAGITTDPTTWTQPAPLLADLAASFHDLHDPAATDLAHRLTPFVTGSFRTLFDGPTTTPPTGHLVVFSLKDLPEQLHGIGTLTALDATWRTITNPHTRRPRLVLVDEAWLLLQHPAGAQFLLRLAKAARKHWAGLTLITQDATDLLSSDLGRAVISNAATHILLRTASQAAPMIATEYGLSEPEQAFLTTAATGTGLLLSHTGHHIPFAAEASDTEDLMATTDPAQLAHLNTRHTGQGGRDSGQMTTEPPSAHTSGTHSWFTASTTPTTALSGHVDNEADDTDPL